MTRYEQEAMYRFETLVGAHRLGPTIGAPEIFLGRCEVDDATIHLVGFASDLAGESVTGSAAGSAGFPVERAYMEWLERVGTVVAEGRVSPGPLLDEDGCEAATARVDPPLVDEAQWRSSRSSGVAIGPGFSVAARRAAAELAERDALLRSWYGETAPRLLEGAADRVPRALHRYYEFRAATFASTERPGAGFHVAGMFAFPRRVAGEPVAPEALFACGFGADLSLDGALGRAAVECVQGVGFLWGENVPDACPRPSPTPSFHQAHFLFEKHQAQVMRWLEGEHVLHEGVLRDLEPRQSPLFLDLSPPWLEGLRLVKAVPRGHVPLGFGVGHPWAPDVPEALAVHPFC